jgi:HPt (histidine-containing phosphotransfer) domain-containing protein
VDTRHTVFDPEKLMNDLQSDGALLTEILGVFVRDASGQIDAMADAVKDGVAADVRSHAHTLKGSAANVGAMALSEAAARLESLARSGDLGKAATLFGILEHEYGKLVARLKSEGLLT